MVQSVQECSHLVTTDVGAVVVAVVDVVGVFVGVSVVVVGVVDVVHHLTNHHGNRS